VLGFLRWHVGFWCRYAPRRGDGSWPSMQQREATPLTRTRLEALLARADEPALEYVTNALLAGDPIDPERAPAAEREYADHDVLVEG
jgi:hypothetical protein